MKFKQTLPPHKSLIKSEGRTSTFSQAVSGALIQQLWQPGLRAWPCCLFMSVLDCKITPAAKGLITPFLIRTVQEQQSVHPAPLSAGSTVSNLRKVCSAPRNAQYGSSKPTQPR